MVITDFQHYWKSKTDKGHEFTFAHGKEFKDVETFTVLVEHNDKVRNEDGRCIRIQRLTDTNISYKYSPQC